MALTLFNRFFCGHDPDPQSSDLKRVDRRILLVSPFPREQNTARVISISERWRVRIAPTLDVALKFQQEERITVVLYDQNLLDVEWHQGISVLLRSSGPLCVILLSFFVQERLRRDVLAHGGYDVAIKPLDRKTLIPLVNGCCMLTNDINFPSCR